MLRFADYIDRFPEKDRNTTYNARSIPTVDEVEEITAAMTADTVLQILKGQGIYYGYECEKYSDNEIRIIDTSKIVSDVRSEESKAQFERQAKENHKAEIFNNMVHRLKAKAISPEEKKLANILHRSLKISYDEAHRRAKLMLTNGVK